MPEGNRDVDLKLPSAKVRVPRAVAALEVHVHDAEADAGSASEEHEVDANSEPMKIRRQLDVLHRGHFEGVLRDKRGVEVRTRRASGSRGVVDGHVPLQDLERRMFLREKPENGLMRNN